MSEIKVTVGASLRCVDCGELFWVGDTKVIREPETGRDITLYWTPDAVRGQTAVGMSLGSGDTFRCLCCHVMEWCKRRDELTCKQSLQVEGETTHG